MKEKIVIGTAQFGMNYGINNKKGQIKEKEITKILNFALQNGISILDTAPSYGNSEKILGNYFQKNTSKSFKVVTKISHKNNSLEEQLFSSLKNLKIKKIDCLMFHSFKVYNRYKDQISFFLKKYQNSLFNELGISLYTNREILSILDNPYISRVQVPFNLLDNAYRKEKLLLELKSKGKKIDARSIFLQGLFFKKTKNISPFFNPLKKELNQINKIVSENNFTTEDLAIHYVLSKNYIDRIVLGVDSLLHLKKNIESVEKNFPFNSLEKIDSLEVLNYKLLNPSNWEY